MQPFAWILYHPRVIPMELSRKSWSIMPWLEFRVYHAWCSIETTTQPRPTTTLVTPLKDTTSFESLDHWRPVNINPVRCAFPKRVVKSLNGHRFQGQRTSWNHCLEHARKRVGEKRMRVGLENVHTASALGDWVNGDATIDNGVRDRLLS